MTFPIRLILLLFSPGIVFAPAIGAAIDQQKVAEEFQSALSHYQSGQLDRAARGDLPHDPAHHPKRSEVTETAHIIPQRALAMLRTIASATRA